MSSVKSVKSIEFDVPYTQTLPNLDQHIDQIIQDDICWVIYYYLKSSFSYQDFRKRFPEPSVLHMVDTINKIIQGLGLKLVHERYGLLSNRIARVISKKYNVAVSSDLINKIDQAIKTNTLVQSSGEVVRYDFTNTFNWRAGNFGDEGSCFWEDRSRAKKEIQGLGGFAIRYFHREDRDFKDFDTMDLNGRAWIVPYGNTGFIMFNAYGKSLAFFSKVLSRHTGMDYYPVQLMADGSSCGLMYINNSKGIYFDRNLNRKNRIRSINLLVFNKNICYFCDTETRSLSVQKFIDVSGSITDLRVCGDCLAEFKINAEGLYVIE